VLTEDQRHELQEINREWLESSPLPALEAGVAGARRAVGAGRRGVARGR